MSRRRPPCSISLRGGSALLAVLWLVALLTLLATAVTAMTLTRRLAAAELGRAARREAIVDSAIRLTLLQLISDSAATGAASPAVSEQRALRIFGAELTVKIDHEDGRIDLNTAEPPIVVAFLAENGWDEATAQCLVARIQDWKDPDDDTRPCGAELREYLSAGRRYGPRNGPLQSVEELRQVLGFEHVGDQVLDSFTVYSHLNVPVSEDAPPAVARAVREVVGNGTGGRMQSVTEHRTSADIVHQLDEPGIRPGDVVRVHSCIDGGVAYCRVAIVRLTGNLQRPFQVFEWTTEQNAS